MQEPYFQKYLRLVDPLVPTRDQLVSQQERFIRWAKCLDADCTTILHNPYTWTLREVLKHLSDCERVFTFRALWIARGESEALASFDENRFLKNSGVMNSGWEMLLDEFYSVRLASVTLFGNLPDEAWTRRGMAGGYPVDVNMLCGMVYGHLEHHFSILKDRVGAST
ncbi:MAG: DinB family protein [Planctomycetota bacterium]|jgi:hypothetical protein